MGKYRYADGEKEINKVLRLNEIQSEQVSRDIHHTLDETDRIAAESEALLKRIGYSREIMGLEQDIKAVQLPRKEISMRSWEELTEEANTLIDDEVEIEDLLSAAEFETAYEDLDRINKAFASQVSLDKTDISLLMVATALQTLRWILTPQLGDKINPETRIDDKTGDSRVRKSKVEYSEKHKDWDTSKVSKGRKGREMEGKSWKEIVFSSVPYDATAGAPAQKINMGGKYHRYRTLGHDPVLGWIFGTANILTDTITLNGFTSYRVENMRFTNERVPLPLVFEESYRMVEDDRHRLPAAIFRQGLHFQSDKYTKLGLPVPFLGVFSDELAGKLYRSQYDALCLSSDLKKVGKSASIAIFINMVIGLIHGLFYKPEIHGDKDLYEVKTRKILMYSNLLASSSNIITVCVTNNPKRLDVGGLLVTASRLFTDTRFIARIKQEFIERELQAGMEQQLLEADRLFEQGI